MAHELAINSQPTTSTKKPPQLTKAWLNGCHQGSHLSHRGSLLRGSFLQFQSVMDVKFLEIYCLLVLNAGNFRE